MKRGTPEDFEIGKSYRILPLDSEKNDLHGLEGKLTKINPHNSDGDFYGIQFPDDEAVLFFWAEELQRIP